MEKHKAEHIMQAVVAAVTGLATTGSNVSRGRVQPQEVETYNALSVYMGPDTPLVDELQNWTITDSILIVIIDIMVKTNNVQIDTQLNQIRQELTVALFTDYTQGLDFILELEEGQTQQPELEGEGSLTSASMRTLWEFKYRRARNNPSQ